MIVLVEVAVGLTAIIAGFGFRHTYIVSTDVHAKFSGSQYIGKQIIWYLSYTREPIHCGTLKFLSKGVGQDHVHCHFV